jgi:hypothetical protein
MNSWKSVDGVLAAIEDVDERDRQHVRGLTPQVPIQRLALGRRGGMGGRERHAEQRVGAEPPLVRGAVEHDQQAVKARLVQCVEASDRLCNLAVHVRHRVEDALPAVSGPVAIAQLDRLVRTGRGARRDDRASPCTAIEPHLDLDRGVAARVEHLAPMDREDRRPHRSGRASTPGSFLPSTNSSEAPPPVETWLI